MPKTLTRLAADRPAARGKIAAMVQGFCNLFDADSRLFRFLLVGPARPARPVTPEMSNPVETVRGVDRRRHGCGRHPGGRSRSRTAMVMGIILQTATFKVYGRIQQPLGDLAPTLAAACWKTSAFPRKG